MLHQDADRLDRQAILALQHKGLAAMGQRLAQSEAWRAHFAQAGMTPQDLASADGLAHAPMMEKSLLRQHAGCATIAMTSPPCRLYGS